MTLENKVVFFTMCFLILTSVYFQKNGLRLVNHVGLGSNE